MPRQINAAGLAIIKASEGLALKAYLCPAGVLTIGYGHTGNDVLPGQVITEAEAEEILQVDLQRFEDSVDRGLTAQARAATTGNQFSAMVSFCFNVGTQAFKKSTLLRKHNAGETQAAADQFLRWNKAGGRILEGLTARRRAERSLYLTPDGQEAA